jgi:hypothetical protein
MLLFLLGQAMSGRESSDNSEAPVAEARSEAGAPKVGNGNLREGSFMPGGVSQILAVECSGKRP